MSAEGLSWSFVGIGGFMVRQRKCHTRLRKSLSASADSVTEGQATETKLEEGKWNQLSSAKHINMHLCLGQRVNG